MKTKLTTILIAMLLLLTLNSLAQTGLRNNGAKIIIPSGTVLHIDGENADFTNSTVSGEDGSITLSGKLKLDGNWANNATSGDLLDRTSGKVIFSGSANQSIGGTRETHWQAIDILDGATLEIGTTQQITIDGDIVMNGSIFLKADANSVASFINNAAISGAGEATVQQYLTGSNNQGIPDGRFWYLASPISNAKSSVFNAASGNRLWYFTEESGTYTEITDNTTDLTVALGYVARMTDNTTLNFVGDLNYGNINANTSWNASSYYPGFNLVGNPYPSGIDWTTMGRTNLRPTFWYRTHSGNAMVYDSFNASSGIGTNNNGSGAISKFVPAMQTFWIRCENNNATGQVSFQNSDRHHKLDNQLYKSSENPDHILRLRAERGVFSDETIFCFFADAIIGFDEYDSGKMYPTDDNLPQIFTTDPAAGDLAMQSLPWNIGNLSVPMGFKTEITDTFAINAYNISELNPDILVYLEDLVDNTYTDLRQNPVYNFSSGISNSFRFVVHFFSLITDDETNFSAEKTETQIYSFRNFVYLKTPAEKYQVRVFDMLGKLIVEKQLAGSTLNKIEMHTASGNYLVHLIGEKSISTEKVFINNP